MSQLLGILAALVFMAWVLRRFGWRETLKQRHAREVRDPRWRARRERYYRTHEKRCRWRGCSETWATAQIDLNHLRYRRHLWDARDSELVPLCRRHHEEFHSSSRR